MMSRFKHGCRLMIVRRAVCGELLVRFVTAKRKLPTWKANSSRQTGNQEIPQSRPRRMVRRREAVALPGVEISNKPVKPDQQEYFYFL